jgi:hypothetical protein
LRAGDASMTTKSRGYEPKDPPPEPRLNIDEWGRVQKMFEDSGLAKYVMAAGWGAGITVVLEIGRIVWLAARYLKGF